MKMINASTQEVDDHALAVSEILEQLDMDNQLLKNSVGYLTCSPDYVETGMAKAICEALPFDVAGCTTLANANNQDAGTMMLSLSVLTADDCVFTSAQTPPLDSVSHAEAADLIRAAAARATDALGEAPKLIIAFMPMITTLSGELMLSVLNEATGGVPMFGSVACGLDSTYYTNTFTIHNGECAPKGLSLIALGGNLQPKFVQASISEHNLYQQAAVITSSDGNILKEVNGMPVLSYLASIGLLQDGQVEAASTMPFVVNFNDGSQPVSRAIFALNDDGSASCGGVMPEGGTLSIGNLDPEDILLTAEQSIDKLFKNQGIDSLLLFSCLGRNIALGLTPMIEAEKVAEVMADRLPWHFAYSGGEVCPVYDGGGKTVNRFHNFTFVGCAL